MLQRSADKVQIRDSYALFSECFGTNNILGGGTIEAWSYSRHVGRSSGVHLAAHSAQHYS